MNQIISFAGTKEKIRIQLDLDGVVQNIPIVTLDVVDTGQRHPLHVQLLQNLPPPPKKQLPDNLENDVQFQPYFNQRR